jgi:hypothetical protein
VNRHARPPRCGIRHERCMDDQLQLRPVRDGVTYSLLRTDLIG